MESGWGKLSRLLVSSTDFRCLRRALEERVRTCHTSRIMLWSPELGFRISKSNSSQMRGLLETAFRAWWIGHFKRRRVKILSILSFPNFSCCFCVIYRFLGELFQLVASWRTSSPTENLKRKIVQLQVKALRTVSIYSKKSEGES